jgi:hypothetical protein
VLSFFKSRSSGSADITAVAEVVVGGPESVELAEGPCPTDRMLELLPEARGSGGGGGGKKDTGAPIVTACSGIGCGIGGCCMFWCT